MIKDQRGVALPLALIVMLVVSLLGTSLWQYSMNDTKQVTRQDNKMKAYYVARSGAEATAMWMKKNNAGGLVGKTSAGNAFGDGTYSVEVKDAGDMVIVEAVGTVGGVSEKVALALKKVSPFAPGAYMFDNAIFAEDLVVLSGNVTIEGDVESGGTVTINGNAVDIIGYYYENSIVSYPMAIFPELVNASPVDFIKTSGQPNIYPVDVNLRYNKIEASRDISFNTYGGIVEVRADIFETRNADIHIIGDGKVYLYVDTTFDLKGSVHGLPHQFVVIMGPESNVSLPIGNSVFNGYVYGPNANVSFSGTQNFFGAIIAKTAYTNGNTGIFYNLPDEQKPPADDVEFEPNFEIQYWLDV